MGFSWHMRKRIIKKETAIKAVSQLHYAYSTALFLAELLPSRAPLRLSRSAKIINYLNTAKIRLNFNTHFDP